LSHIETKEITQNIQELPWKNNYRRLHLSSRMAATAAGSTGSLWLDGKRCNIFDFDQNIWCCFDSSKKKPPLGVHNVKMFL